MGLQNAGKSSFVHVIQTGTFEENMIPTIGFNMRKVQKGKVMIKIWDMGGQQQFRGMWERYCRDVEAIVFVVDSADDKAFTLARDEIKRLFENHPALNSIPLLVLMNKNDLPEAKRPDEIAAALELDQITDREVAYYSISCKNMVNINQALQWLTNHSRRE